MSQSRWCSSSSTSRRSRRLWTSRKGSIYSTGVSGGTVDGAEVQIAIDSDEDVIPARAEGRALADQLGFSRTDATLIATAISEIARNILVHAGSGAVVVAP